MHKDSLIRSAYGNPADANRPGPAVVPTLEREARFEETEVDA